jgi:hypothetical protein
MTDNDGVGDVSAIQTPPPIEIQLTAPIQNVHKMVADHPALASLASHGCFLLMLYLVSLPSQVLSVCRTVGCPQSQRGSAYKALSLIDHLADRHFGVTQHLIGFFLHILRQIVKLAARPGT